MQTALGILSGLVLIAGDIPYAINAIKGRTKPHRVTWGVILILNFITLANQIAVGATNSLGMIIGGIIAVGSIFIISIRHDTGGTKRSDILVLAGALIGLILWWLADSPLASISINIIVSLLALIPTFKKAWIDPHSETSTTWLMGSISGLLAMASVGHFDTPIIIIPLYDFLIQAVLYAIIVIRRHGRSA